MRPSVHRRRFLVTAGSTREPIDRVRDWGNIFTGNTGLDIALALAAQGDADVDLLTSNVEHVARLREADGSVRPIAFKRYDELYTLCALRMQSGPYDAIVMTAAVCDYKPVGTYSVEAMQGDTWRVRDVQAGKVRSTHARIAVLAEPTLKIIDQFRATWGHAGVLVKFKLEVGIGADELIAVGQRSRVHSGAEILVANTIDMVDGPRAGALLLSDQGSEFVGRGVLASTLAQQIRSACERESNPAPSASATV
ncbi:MAG: phosphopantothenoylcysteine decarboxylase [Tepidisphaeraceae bacterium]